MKVSSLAAVWRSQGTRGSLRVALDIVRATRSAVAPEVLAVATGARAVEIGGPSRCFRRRGIVPIYPVVGSLDIVNFSSSTLWEGTLVEGSPFAPEGRNLGVQLLREASCLEGVADQTYDVVASSHCLEHCADALGTLREWRRVCRDDGYLCLVVPHRDGTFDWRRAVTSMQHYRDDALAGVSEDDETHFEEINRLHDVRRDPGVPSHEELRRRLARNSATRAAHHHVLTLASAVDLVMEAGWSPVAADVRRPYDIVVLARKSPSVTSQVDLADVARRSPFASDRDLARRP